jgi:hypothetical protein
MRRVSEVLLCVCVCVCVLDIVCGGVAGSVVEVLFCDGAWD